jgi:cyclopropane-fatty-acyl-phospholipid synthase
VIATSTTTGPGPALGDRACRVAVLAALSSLDSGLVVLREPRRPPQLFGTGKPDRYGRPALRVTVDVHDARAYRAVLRGASAGLGEAWIEGWWECDDLTAFLRLLSRAVRRFDPARNVASRSVGRVADGLRARWRRPDASRDRANIAAHYDLGNDLFSRFLDDSMTYSSGWFRSADDTLLDASTEKLDRLCRGLQLRPSDHVLEIGTGWGSFALHAASRYGCRVTTTTLSAEQHDTARERVARAGLGDRVEVLNDDYRDVRGTYDKLASIEMIEAVDWRELDTFFRTCTDRLAPDGLMGLQAIVSAGSRWQAAKSSRDFVKTHVFPGGCLPSIESISRSLGRVTDLSMLSLQDFGLHYAETLRRWRAGFGERTGELAALGYDRRFARLWEFYLCYCEAGFEEREVSVVQSILARPGHRPATPWQRSADTASSALNGDRSLAVTRR